MAADRRRSGDGGQPLPVEHAERTQRAWRWHDLQPRADFPERPALLEDGDAMAGGAARARLAAADAGADDDRVE